MNTPKPRNLSLTAALPLAAAEEPAPSLDPSVVTRLGLTGLLPTSSPQAAETPAPQEAAASVPMSVGALRQHLATGFSDIMGIYVKFLREDAQEGAVYNAALKSLGLDNDPEIAALPQEQQMRCLFTMLAYQLNTTRNLRATLGAALGRLGALQDALSDR